MFHDEAALEAKLSLERDFTEYLFKNVKARFVLKSTPQEESLLPLCLMMSQSCLKPDFPTLHRERAEQFCPLQEALLDAIFNQKVKLCTINQVTCLSTHSSQGSPESTPAF